jgi:hypothetical protein
MNALGWNYPVFGAKSSHQFGVITNDVLNGWLNFWPPQPYEASSFSLRQYKMYSCILVDGNLLNSSRSNYFCESLSTHPKKE